MVAKSHQTDSTASPSHTPKLVVVLPALNEESTIHDVITGIPRQMEGVGTIEILVVDDGSTDRTAESARSAGAAVHSFPSHRGLGAAVAKGLELALARQADVVVTMDSDGQFNPADIPKLIAPILQQEADFVTCTRFAAPGAMREMAALKRWGNRLMCRLIHSVVGGPPLTDVCCGFRAYSRDTVLKLHLYSRYCYNEETLIALADKDLRMQEIPLEVLPQRPHGRSRLITSIWRYAYEMVPILLRTTRDLMPLKFFGVLGLLSLILGSWLGLWVISWWLYTRETHPFTSFLIGSATFLILGFLLIVLALVADMIGRLKRTQEQILYHLRKNEGLDGDRTSDQPDS